MNKIQCPNGHYYDADMFTECPHCKNADDPKTGEGGILHRLKRNSLQNLWRVNEPPAEQEEKTVALQAHAVSGSSEERTVGFFESLHAEPKPAAKATEENRQKRTNRKNLICRLFPLHLPLRLIPKRHKFFGNSPNRCKMKLNRKKKPNISSRKKNSLNGQLNLLSDGWYVLRAKGMASALRSTQERTPSEGAQIIGLALPMTFKCPGFSMHISFLNPDPESFICSPETVAD